MCFLFTFWTNNFSFQVGCDNVHFQCQSTDVNYILGKYHDFDVHGDKVEITNAKCCLLKKCKSFVTKETENKIKSENLKCWSEEIINTVILIAFKI